jgi:hypothetical protein
MKPNKEQIEALINDGKYDAAAVEFADLHGIPASEVALFVSLIISKERAETEFAYKDIAEFE